MLEFLLSTAMIVGQMSINHNHIQTDFLTTTGELITITQSVDLFDPIGGVPCILDQ